MHAVQTQLCVSLAADGVTPVLGSKVYRLKLIFARNTLLDLLPETARTDCCMVSVVFCTRFVVRTDCRMIIMDFFCPLHFLL